MEFVDCKRYYVRYYFNKKIHAVKIFLVCKVFINIDVLRTFLLVLKLFRYI